MICKANPHGPSSGNHVPSAFLPTHRTSLSAIRGCSLLGTVCHLEELFNYFQLPLNFLIQRHVWKENENGSRFLLGSIILSFPPDWLWFHSNPPASEQAPLKGSPLGTGLAVWAVSHSISTHLNHVTSAPEVKLHTGFFQSIGR